LVLFAAGSAGCAFAPNAEVFIAARVLLGLAGAAMIVLALSIVTVMFDEAERPRASAYGCGQLHRSPPGTDSRRLDPVQRLVGWIFLMNVPVALVGLIAVVALVPESDRPNGPASTSVA